MDAWIVCESLVLKCTQLRKIKSIKWNKLNSAERILWVKNAFGTCYLVAKKSLYPNIKNFRSLLSATVNFEVKKKKSLVYLGNVRWQIKFWGVNVLKTLKPLFLQYTNFSFFWVRHLSIQQFIHLLIFSEGHFCWTFTWRHCSIILLSTLERLWHMETLSLTFQLKMEVMCKVVL